MRNRKFRGQCYVCRKWYGAEDLGRVALPLYMKREKVRRLEVLCRACAAGLYDSLLALGRPDAMVMHGF